jgi:hypothetical protein
MTQRIAWYTQNEATDTDGFYLENEACWNAERALLLEDGAPDAASAVFVSWEAEDRTESVLVAEVSDALAAWLQDNVSVVEDDNA